MEKIIVIVGTIIVGLAGILLVSFLLSWPTMMLWNYCLVDAVSGIKEITWLQAWGISVLCGILFRTSSSKQSVDQK